MLHSALDPKVTNTEVTTYVTLNYFMFCPIHYLSPMFHNFPFRLVISYQYETLTPWSIMLFENHETPYQLGICHGQMSVHSALSLLPIRLDWTFQHLSTICPLIYFHVTFSHLLSDGTKCNLSGYNKQNSKLRGFNPLTNYTGRPTAAWRWS
jgi:hypothetical protein